jgi:hypothetical protein
MQTAAEVNMDQHEEQYTEPERNAMRSFLQRCEVRISTQHRVATAFIGGAGLLLLIPIFFRDIVDGILIVLLETIGNYFAALGVTGGWIASLILFGLLCYPFFLSLAIPLYSLYLMLKDIVHFYFSLYTPGLPHTLLNPSFSLTGLAFPEDESQRVRRAVNRFQYDEENSAYMLPFSEKRRGLYFDLLIEDTHGEIIPSERHVDRLAKTASLPEGYDPKHTARVSAAFGLARSIGRTLAEEVAVTEMLLARNNMYLRRLLLRYVKTLLMFIWTTLLSFLMLPFLSDSRFPTLLVLAISYVIWSVGVMPIVRTPFNWIFKHRYSREETKHIDQQLTLLERNIAPFSHLAIVGSIVALVMSVVAYLV